MASCRGLGGCVRGDACQRGFCPGNVVVMWFNRVLLSKNWLLVVDRGVNRDVGRIQKGHEDEVRVAFLKEISLAQNVNAILF